LEVKQKTINSSFRLEGKGLHTGGWIHATFLPAEVNTGIRICRTDLPGRPACKAVADYVTETTRGTVLEHGLWRISTVEHMMAALYATGVTNCLIEVDAPEIPILDGSAHCYVEALRQAGLREQEEEVNEWVVTEPVTFADKKSRMTLTPSDHYEVEVKVSYPSPVLGEQTARLTDLSAFADEIADARTFCFLREIKPLLNFGLIRGGDMQNALVIYDKRIWQCSMNRLARRLGQPTMDASQLGYLSPLKYPNEPVRHKLLDVIGDMALLGVHIRGKITAECPGHWFNTACCKQLKETINKN
ncbi:MAG: UDP-3-O-acyl-N-acetylglucosamine deacetylase, partial [Paludibacteraceae bacterium]|nr:UDP-3-O-acyl-N-acetylglucosamine deacetylase [Paludibacteraceae bacterium]